ncbi:c-type cytochrome [Tellurirhabdus rosea]|uniref:c-type cytochrome n=1 Tax=Tellurirhabdus rosea TaxID=2674997 RepID=UPI00225062E9|nr:cytochrome c [Tellurirhabdus rosea]
MNQEETVERTPQRVLRGEKIAQFLCVSCHADNQNRLTGKRMTDVPKAFGKIYSSNITQHPTTGIGAWSDSDLLRFLRTGRRPNGSLAPAMPRFPLMADEDLRSIVAWLRSDAFPVQASEQPAPRSRYSLPVKLIAKKMFRPLPMPQKVILVPDSTDSVAFGRYVADGMVGCFNCHSAGLTRLNPLEPSRSKGYYGGGTRLIGENGKPVYSSNLTPDRETGIGRAYTRETFVRAVRWGVGHDGKPLRYPMMPHVTLTEREAGAIYDYLQTLTPARVKIPKG